MSLNDRIWTMHTEISRGATETAEYGESQGWRGELDSMQNENITYKLANERCKKMTETCRFDAEWKLKHNS